MAGPERDHSLDTLLDMVGVFVSPDGWWIKTEARKVSASKEQPFGVKYSLTLHTRDGSRVLGYDNAHSVPGHRRIEWDHKHLKNKIRPYRYSNAAKLLEDFYTDVDRWLNHDQ